MPTGIVYVMGCSIQPGQQRENRDNRDVRCCLATGIKCDVSSNHEYDRANSLKLEICLKQFFKGLESCGQVSGLLLPQIQRACQFFCSS